MSGSDFSLIDDGRAHHLKARVRGEKVRLSAEDVRSVLGWELKPQGLCQADICIPVRDRDNFADAEGIDLAVLAGLLQRPLALDAAAGAGFLGVSAGERGRRLASLEAPDFTLPDLNGAPHSLSDYKGRKVLLVAYASW